MPELPANLPDWISAISQLLLVLIFVALFTGANQRLQVYLWSRDIRAKLNILEAFAGEARKKTLEYMASSGAKEAESTLKRLTDFFVISPVDIEPVDIIRRLEHLVNLRQRRFKEEVAKIMPESDDVVRSKAEVAVEITSALTFISKFVRHLLLTGEKTRNWILIMQLQLLMPLILKMADTYRRALYDFLKGVPIGDSAGPMVALRLAGVDASWERIEEETVYTVKRIDGREVYIVKAEGPGSSVGRPGSATERLIEKLVAGGKKPRLLITVDAALKLEGEESGSVAEGVGAAIGDIGPEKIRFERVSVKYGIALRAVAIKMSLEEAILGMNEKIARGVEKAVETVRSMISRESREGDVVVVVGVGNTVGVGQ
ncbi:MAG: DUF1512 domain-containing protein [Aeropyrum sp.]|nr:DUF1512 domain-containing protein [Aeropyrum sp.]MCE4616068.1 DUF1512 domain-containing protein [Aeropyrum sp.]